MARRPAKKRSKSKKRKSTKRKTTARKTTRRAKPRRKKAKKKKVRKLKSKTATPAIRKANSEYRAAKAKYHSTGRRLRSLREGRWV